MDIGLYLVGQGYSGETLTKAYVVNWHKKVGDIWKQDIDWSEKYKLRKELAKSYLGTNDKYRAILREIEDLLDNDGYTDNDEEYDVDEIQSEISSAANYAQQSADIDEYQNDAILSLPGIFNEVNDNKGHGSYFNHDGSYFVFGIDLSNLLEQDYIYHHINKWNGGDDVEIDTLVKVYMEEESKISVRESYGTMDKGQFNEEFQNRFDQYLPKLEDIEINESIITNFKDFI
jgi:hypothetical protein